MSIPIVDIIIEGKVVPNNTKVGYNYATRRPIMYKPAKVKAYKDKIRSVLALHMQCNDIKPTKKPVAIYLNIDIELPKSYSKKKKLELLNGYELGKAPAPVKPDMDNCQKLIIDAISKDAWSKGAYILENDSQVCAMYVYKRYAKTASVRFRVEHWG